MLRNNDFIPSPLSQKRVEFVAYVTDEENYEPYTSLITDGEAKPQKEKSEKKKKKDEKKKDKKKNDEDKKETTSPDKLFNYHLGEIKETIQIPNIISVEWNNDYNGMGGDARIQLTYTQEYLKYLYRGVRCNIMVSRKDYNDTELQKTNYLCFIKDLKFSENGIELSLISFSTLLDETKKLSYANMKRSEILREVILNGGLKPNINVKGFDDDVVTSWTSVQKTSTSKNSNDDGATGEGDGKMTEQQITDLAKKVTYCGMGCHHDLEKSYNAITKQHKGDCWEASAFLYYAYWKHLGIPTKEIYASSTVASSGYHHCTMIKKNGEWTFPPFYDHCTNLLKVSGNMKSGQYKTAREPPTEKGFGKYVGDHP